MVETREPEGQSGLRLPAAEDIVRYVVAFAVWAPSVHNTQPWRFSAEGQEISLHADRARQLTLADPDGREMLISCGAALFTARLALRSLGYIPEAALLPDPARADASCAGELAGAGACHGTRAAAHAADPAAAHAPWWF